MPANLILHCGAAPTTEADLLALPSVPSTKSWVPMAHSEVRREILERLHGLYTVRQERIGVTPDGHNCFGVFDLADTVAEGVALSVGWRNSTAKLFSAAMCAGINPLVCDNLLLTGDVVTFAKHTTNVRRTLPARMDAAFLTLPAWREQQTAAIETLKGVLTPDAYAHDMMVEAAARDIMPWSAIGKVHRVWTDREEVQPPQFRDQSAWSLLNAFTEYQKERFSTNAPEAAKRSADLAGLFFERFDIRMGQQTPEDN